jgi:hypothetical protein
MTKSCARLVQKASCQLITTIYAMSAASIPKIVELPLDEDDEVKPSTSKTTLRPVERGTSGASRKKSAASSSPPSSSSSWTRFLIKWTLFTLLTAFGAAQFIAGDLLWGYRGKYTKVETYMPVSKGIKQTIKDHTS